jgi:hypothetical protein
MRCEVSGLRNGADLLRARDKTIEEWAEALRLDRHLVVDDGLRSACDDFSLSLVMRFAAALDVRT